jgi:mannose-6-phosphate isomerase-like protein (cupin superfamily)
MPYHVVTGLGPDGRSTVISREPRVVRSVHEENFAADDSGIRADKDASEMLMARLYEAETSPPSVPRQTRAPLLPTPLKPGATLWMEMKFAGMSAYDLHRTDTIDLHYVLGGAVELKLENGSVHLSPGDTVVVPGVLHAWHSPKGWSSSLFVIGLSPS